MERAGLPGAAGFVRADYFEKVYWSEQARRAVDGAGGYGIYYDNMGRLIKRAFANPIASPAGSSPSAPMCASADRRLFSI